MHVGILWIGCRVGFQIESWFQIPVQKSNAKLSVEIESHLFRKSDSKLGVELDRRSRVVIGSWVDCWVLVSNRSLDVEVGYLFGYITIHIGYEDRAFVWASILNSGIEVESQFKCRIHIFGSNLEFMFRSFVTISFHYDI